ncbi:MAG TPA: EAL domain-containing protein [Polyangiaceae bacterium]|nr:EAL domain-containing protein [Polyangiaceae bacterium]
MLIVDDEPQVLVALEDLLSEFFDVVATDDPARALRLAEQEPDLAVILSDERMPHMNGHELLARLRERCSAARLLVTGYADLQAIMRAINEGQIFAYVTKPWDAPDLTNKVVRAAEHFRLTQDLADERQLLHGLMNSMPDAIYFKDREHRFVRVNRGFLDMFGVADESRVIGARLSEMLDGSPVAHALELAEKPVLLGTEARCNAEHPHPRRGDDEPAWLSTTNAAIVSPSGAVIGLVGIARDVTDRVRAQSALQASEERLRLAFAASNAILFDCDLGTGEVSLLGPKDGPVPAAGARFDVAELERLVHPEDRSRVAEALSKHLQSRAPFQALELRALADSGEYRWFEIHGQATWDESGKALRLVGSSVDITTRKEHAAQAARLAFLSSHDEVTGLPNRQLLATELERRIALNRTSNTGAGALALFDLSRLRQVNESFGRQVGDDLLREMGARLSALAEANDLVARLDSSMFAVLLDRADAGKVGEWLRHVSVRLSQAFTLRPGELRVAVAAGVALFPNDGASAEELVAKARAAQEAAKRSGRAHCFYAPSMSSSTAERLKLESNLRRALVRSEFVLFYQPKVELRTGRVVGVEALLRWKDPERGLIAPGAFIPVLEETGMIADVGSWVLAEAARQYTQWKSAERTPPRIAVNVSALQLQQPNFLETLDAAISKHPEARHGLDLEITESVLAGDVEDNIQKMRAVKERGFKIAIDDFGTGYSSLRYLSRLPLDALKVDRTFVDAMAEDPQQMTIVTSIISLAQALGLKVIAEGVETTMQAHLLRLLRCDEMQGYLVSKPLPAPEAEPLLARVFEVQGSFAKT